MKEALKEILRIVQTNGGLEKGDEINITYCSGLWRIEEIAKHALRKEDKANARLIASAPELLEMCKLNEKQDNQTPIEVQEALAWFNDNRDDFTDQDRIAIDALTKHINKLAKVEGESAT